MFQLFGKEHLVNVSSGHSKINEHAIENPTLFVAWLIVIRIYDLLVEMED